MERLLELYNEVNAFPKGNIPMTNSQKGVYHELVREFNKHLKYKQSNCVCARRAIIHNATKFLKGHGLI